MAEIKHVKEKIEVCVNGYQVTILLPLRLSYHTCTFICDVRIPSSLPKFMLNILISLSKMFLCAIWLSYMMHISAYIQYVPCDQNWNFLLVLLTFLIDEWLSILFLLAFVFDFNMLCEIYEKENSHIFETMMLLIQLSTFCNNNHFVI